MKQITESFADETYQKLFAELTEKYGEGWSWREQYREDYFELSETYRGLNVLALWQKSDSKTAPETFLNSYSIHEQVIPILVTRYLGKTTCAKPEELREPTRAEKIAKFLQWANSHHFEQFTTEQLTEQLGFSYPTTLKYLQTSPTFRKLKKGLWEIRDAKADRGAQGNKTIDVSELLGK